MEVVHRIFPHTYANAIVDIPEEIARQWLINVHRIHVEIMEIARVYRRDSVAVVHRVILDQDVNNLLISA